jgi:hypothetical protein
MLEHLSNSHVQVCQERAAEARAKAEVTEDPVLKAEFLDIVIRWLDLAESFAASDDLGHFTPTRSAFYASHENSRGGTCLLRSILERRWRLHGGLSTGPKTEAELAMHGKIRNG